MICPALNSYIFLISVTFCIFSSNGGKISEHLRPLMEKPGGPESFDILVQFHNSIQDLISSASTEDESSSRVDRNNKLVHAMKKHVKSSQAGVHAILEDISDSLLKSDPLPFRYVRSYWTSNKMFIRNASRSTIKQIETDENVYLIQIAPVFDIDWEVAEAFEDPWRDSVVQDAWREVGSPGEGVVVGIIDTGARHTHSRLKESWIGGYGWFDGTPTQKLAPWDSTPGHGSLVTGIIVGSRGSNHDGKYLGVAPGAKWMSCMACLGSSCDSESILNCISFMACPTLANGTAGNCSKAPNVINFSMAGKTNHFDEDLQTLHALGIILVGPVGNGGPNCQTVEFPAQNSFMISVGAVIDRSWLPGSYENWKKGGVGPGEDGSTKPDVVAPGRVLGPVSGNDQGLWGNVGTSLAAPHVTGIVALLLVRNKELRLDDAKRFLTTTASFENVTVENEFCPRAATNHTRPNNILGWGLVNAFRAVQAQTKELQKK